MGAPYATAQDLADRWRPLSPSEQERASVLLGDAATRIRAAVSDVDARVNTGALDAGIPLLVSVEMVRRAMLAPVDQAPAGQVQQTAGPFSKSVSFANPTGDLYLTKAERQMLGGGGQRAFTVPMGGPSRAVHRPWCNLAFGASWCSCGADIAGVPIYE